MHANNRSTGEPWGSVEYMKTLPLYQEGCFGGMQYYLQEQKTGNSNEMTSPAYSN